MTFNPANLNLKKSLMKHWYSISENNTLVQIYPNFPNCCLPEGQVSKRFSCQSIPSVTLITQ